MLRVNTYGEGRPNFPAEYAPTGEGARLPGENEHKKRAACPETTPRQGPQTSDGQQRVASKGPLSRKAGMVTAGRISVAGLSQRERVRRRADYQQIYDRGTKVHGKLLTLFTLSNNLTFGRLGIAATRKIGGAAVRNRAKRLIREIFRRNKLAPGFDVVVIPKREMIDASLTAIEAEFRNTLERSLRRRR